MAPPSVALCMVGRKLSGTNQAGTLSAISRQEINKKNIMKKNQIHNLCLLVCLGLSTAALTQNPDYKFTDVTVDTMNGTVQLSGFVNTSDQRSKAVEIAKGVQGAKD